MQMRPPVGDGGAEAGTGRGSVGTDGVCDGGGDGRRDRGDRETKAEEAQPATPGGGLGRRLRPPLQPLELRNRPEVPERLLPVLGEEELLRQESVLVPPGDVLAGRP